MTTPQYVGPKTAEPNELKDVIDLANRVFRKSGGGDMGREYPMVFDPARLERLRVFQCQGRCVSLVATVLSDAVLLGCDVRLAAIGSVCTDEAHRGHDLAGRLVEDAVQRALEAGACLMLISGGRTLYTRRGAAPCGRFAAYSLRRTQLGGSPAELELVELEAANCASALRLFECEPIRYRRDVPEYAQQLSCRWVVNRPGGTFLVRRGGRPLAVMSVNRRETSREDKSLTLDVCEMAGSRGAIVAALPALADAWGIDKVMIHAYANDVEMRDRMEQIGADARDRSFGGTVKLLDAGRLWMSFLPLIAERIGPRAAGEIRLSLQADDLQLHTLTFRLGPCELTLQGADRILSALFGAKDKEVLAEYSGELADLLRTALPLPLPMYGLNYV